MKRRAFIQYLGSSPILLLFLLVFGPDVVFRFFKIKQSKLVFPEIDFDEFISVQSMTQLPDFDPDLLHMQLITPPTGDIIQFKHTG